MKLTIYKGLSDNKPYVTVDEPVTLDDFIADEPTFYEGSYQHNACIQLTFKQDVGDLLASAHLLYRRWDHHPFERSICASFDVPFNFRGCRNEEAKTRKKLAAMADLKKLLVEQRGEAIAKAIDKFNEEVEQRASRHREYYMQDYHRALTGGGMEDWFKENPPAGLAEALERKAGLVARLQQLRCHIKEIKCAAMLKSLEEDWIVNGAPLAPELIASVRGTLEKNEGFDYRGRGIPDY
jgi:hypothetical protein